MLLADDETSASELIDKPLIRNQVYQFNNHLQNIQL